MVRILIEDGRMSITPEQAMQWFCWAEIVAAMEKQGEVLETVAGAMSRESGPDWEASFLRRFLDCAEHDLIIT